MSDNSSDPPPLPADVNDWPTDPQSLFGVSSDISRRDLKRAYARRIKKYKPEHAPEEFRRLRAAYEQLDRQLEWREGRELHLRLFTEETEQPPATSQADDAVPLGTFTTRAESTDLGTGESEDSQTATERPDSSHSRNPDELWQSALSGGDLTSIYAELVGWLRRRNPSEIDFARLYWLTTLASDVDPDRDPCTWLIEGLRRHRASARLFEMLETEVRRRVGQVPAVLEDRLLDPDDVAWRRVNVAELRWYAARKQGRFDVINMDFQSLKRALIDEPDQWLRLLSTGLRSVVISPSVGLIEQFRRELEYVPAHAADWVWDSIEADLALGKAWSESGDELGKSLWFVSDRLQQIRDLIETTWLVPVPDSRQLVHKFCVSLLEDPHRSLKELLPIERHARPLVRRLHELLHEQMALSGIENDTELTPAVQQELQRFLRDSFPDGNRDEFELTVLDYCLSEAVTPRDLSTVMSKMALVVPEAYFVVAENLTTNLALNCIINANRLLV